MVVFRLQGQTLVALGFVNEDLHGTLVLASGMVTRSVVSLVFVFHFVGFVVALTLEILWFVLKTELQVPQTDLLK